MTSYSRYAELFYLAALFAILWAEQFGAKAWTYCSKLTKQHSIRMPSVFVGPRDIALWSASTNFAATLRCSVSVAQNMNPFSQCPCDPLITDGSHPPWFSDHRDGTIRTGKSSLDPSYKSLDPMPV
jgi:hypothetical protein